MQWDDQAYLASLRAHLANTAWFGQLSLRTRRGMVPLFNLIESSHKLAPKYVGCGSLFRIGSEPFLITARHVSEPNAFDPSAYNAPPQQLYLRSRQNEFVPVDGVACSSGNSEGMHLHDISIFRLGATSRLFLAQNHIYEKNLDSVVFLNRIPTAGPLICTGYPRSLTDHFGDLTPIVMITGIVPPPDGSFMHDPNIHIFAGNHEALSNPAGMSGSPGFIHLHGEDPSVAFEMETFREMGICSQLSKEGNAIRYTSWTLIASMVWHDFPDMQDDLSKCGFTPPIWFRHLGTSEHPNVQSRNQGDA